MRHPGRESRLESGLRRRENGGWTQSTGVAPGEARVRERLEGGSKPGGTLMSGEAGPQWIPPEETARDVQHLRFECQTGVRLGPFRGRASERKELTG